MGIELADTPKGDKKNEIWWEIHELNLRTSPHAANKGRFKTIEDVSELQSEEGAVTT